MIPALVSSDCSQSAESALRRVEMEGILPFRLVGIFPNEARVIEWAWNQRSIERKTSPWSSMQWCSSSLSDAIATAARKRVFERNSKACDAGSLAWASQLHASHDCNDPPFSYCVHRAGVETVSYTELVCSGERIDCSYLASAPCNTHQIRHKTSMQIVRARAFRYALPVNRTERSFVSPRT